MPGKCPTQITDPNLHHLTIKDPGGQETVTKEVTKAKAKVKMVTLYKSRGVPHLVVRRTPRYVTFTRRANVQTVIDVNFGIHQNATHFQSVH